MNRSQGNLQDAFLNSARRDNIPVTIYLVSGVQLRGIIRAFDAFTLLLESQGRPPQMVYKHSIASVAPARAVVMDGPPGREDMARDGAAREEGFAPAESPVEHPVPAPAPPTPAPAPATPASAPVPPGPTVPPLAPGVPPAPERRPDPAETGAEGADTPHTPPES